ncbi:MAG: hypothetical protein H6Q93_730 [Nitrospirae bacterium]|nr:hypothetical protein [Nitrospirota bacterium]
MLQAKLAVLRSLITMTTDFGYDDPFVGVMKGVMYTINPHANIVDLTHNITPQSIQEAAFIIGMHYHYFPKNSIHLVVVDPGVGSARRPLLVTADDHYFIGPDNGVFSYLYRMAAKDIMVIHITSAHFFLMKDSPTFQGRDVFSPCAAWLSTGLDISKFGEVITDYQTIHLPAPVSRDDRILQGEVIFLDRFGNAISNIKKSDINDFIGTRKEDTVRIVIKGNEIRLSSFYSEVCEGILSGVMNSSGYLEIFTYRGNAAAEYQITSGDIVKVALSS